MGFPQSRGVHPCGACAPYTAHPHDPRSKYGSYFAAAPAIELAHNHPSGNATPSDADVRVTRDLIRGGQLLKIEVVDHLVMGNPDFRSLRESGYFYQ